MSEEKQETMADIVREMRIFKCRNLETGELETCNAIANYFADRIEAAWRRAIAELPLDRNLMKHWRDEAVKAWHTEPLLPSKEGSAERRARSRA